MKKFIVFLIITFIVGIFSTGCTDQKNSKQNIIKSKRRFADYVEPQTQKDSNRIDLSEGPKLKYDANLGPQNLNFDIKIVDPYQKY